LTAGAEGYTAVRIIKTTGAPPGLLTGVYYYVVKTIGYFHEDKYKGSITILGGN
jgi:hypothetical protein